MFVTEESFASNVESDHGERNAGIENDASRLRINVEVELGGGRDISARERSTHNGDGFHHGGDRGIGAQRGGDISKRSDCDDGDLPRILANNTADDLTRS